MGNKNIYFSRHAKRRMKLYDLSKEDVSFIIKFEDPKLNFPEGKYEITSQTKFSRHRYPIKVVFSCESNRIIIVTAHPVKKRLKK
jgi:hypothetical protein